MTPAQKAAATRKRRAAATKAAQTKKRRAAAAKASLTRKRNAAAKTKKRRAAAAKAALTRKRNVAARKAAETRKREVPSESGNVFGDDEIADMEAVIDRIAAKNCTCGSGEPWEDHYDSRGTFLTRACVKCWPETRKQFRPVDERDDEAESQKRSTKPLNDPRGSEANTAASG